jgi:hypothetical protein
MELAQTQRVYGVPGFLSSRLIWVPPPINRKGVLLPQSPREEGEGERGDPIPTKGQTLWYCMYTIIPLRSNPSFATAFHRQALPATQRKERINGRLRKVDSCYVGWGLGFEGKKDDIKKGGPLPLYSIYG